MDLKTKQPIWGGRFQQSSSSLLEKINSSVDFDRRLYKQDISASIVHCQMLAKCNIITDKDCKLICDGLLEIENEITNGKFEFRKELEDIHMNIENRLDEKIGDIAGRIHTARSRNDQVATDMRLYFRDYIDKINHRIVMMMESLLCLASKHINSLMPGYTHLQAAQPIVFAHHLLAYMEMMDRNLGRFGDCRRRLNECPLGSAALAGTAFPIDREFTATKLGFDQPMRNSLDAVSDRDFIIETLSCCSITAMHLSRLAEEIILWSSPQFMFVTLSDSFSTGSSIMPQKRNPDAAELVRGKSARIFSALSAILTLLKALPLAYFKDMQEDKELSFDALDTLDLQLEAMTAMIKDIKINKTAMENATRVRFLTATDLADWLVKNLDIPFRKAHLITGRIVAMAEKKSCNIHELSLSDMQSLCKEINEEVFKILDVRKSVESRSSFGGTAPQEVMKNIKYWQKKLQKYQKYYKYKNA